MSAEIVEGPEFFVIGLAERTSNRREISGLGIIGRQWARLYAEGLLQQIPNRVDNDVIAVYADYAGDHTSEYTFLLGARVSSIEQVPERMIARRIPAAKYVMVETERGPVQQVVVAAWQKIWSTSPEELGGERAYRADFEVYGAEASDPQNSQVRIFVGLK
jgi:predicted transcriptional regulator YdeE